VSIEGWNNNTTITKSPHKTFFNNPLFFKINEKLKY
jgi:hypothetical protein